jgi:hypothetical protein
MLKIVNLGLDLVGVLPLIDIKHQGLDHELPSL